MLSEGNESLNVVASSSMTSLSLSETRRKEKQKKVDEFASKVENNDKGIQPDCPLKYIDYLADTPGFWTKFIQALEKNTTITRINYPTNKTIAQRKSTLIEMSNSLKKATTLGNVKVFKLISSVCGVEIVDALMAHSSTLEVVSVKWNPFSVVVAQKWAEYIRTTTALKQLTLNVGREGSDVDTCGMLLAEALERNTSITTALLRSNDFGEKSALQFARVIENNLCLTYLDLSHNRMGTVGFEALFKALVSTKTLNTLVLIDCDINEESTKYLANSLKVNVSLTCLNLYANSLGPVGAHHLCEALKVNSTLRDLDLYGNKLKNEGADSVSKMLKVNRGLLRLSLQSNGIGQVGIQKLSEALQQNSALRSLNIAASIIGQGELALCKMLSENTTLCKLDLRFTDAKKHKIDDALRSRSQHLDVVWLY
eukprot:TRINITY_DN421_c0_g1_i2.p1 TRINITY_DN421_c0_g1~~TRINITY_DN421_c0_g1_i2.p1  ORF type:complete len:426 (+),score=28.48 TRINITY_DN421_c0_g1_i2:99-1376(+)